MTTAFQPSAFQGYAFQIDAVTGSIYVIDENDTATLVGTVTGGNEVDMHDGFKNLKHLKKLEEKIVENRIKREKAFAKANARRKRDIKEQIDPTPPTVKILEGDDADFAIIPSVNLNKINEQLAVYEKERLALIERILRSETNRKFKEFMAAIEQRMIEEKEDEEALLMLI